MMKNGFNGGNLRGYAAKRSAQNYFNHSSNGMNASGCSTNDKGSGCSTADKPSSCGSGDKKSGCGASCNGSCGSGDK